MCDGCHEISILNDIMKYAFDEITVNRPGTFYIGNS